MIRRPRLFILPTVCAAGLAMATFSCGGDDDDDNSGKTPTPTSTDTGVDTGTGTDTGTTTSRTVTYFPGEVDMAVDGNRVGVVDPRDEEDQEHENEWDTQYGASFLANVDDDNGDGVQDGSDADVNITVDNTHDQNDLARIKVTAWPDVPAGSVGTFSVDAAATGHVRIHKLNAADGTWSSVAGSVGPCGAGGDTNCNLVESFQLTAEEIAQGVEIGIEGRHFTGQEDAGDWDGYVYLSFGAVDGDSNAILTENNPTDGVDHVKMMVAPWILFGNLHPVEKIYSSNISNSLVNGLTPPINDAGLIYHTIGNWNDRWTEDLFETGYTGIPAPGGHVHGMRVTIPRPWGRGANIEANLPKTWLQGNHLGLDTGTIIVFHHTSNTGTSFDSYGNHDLIPPYTNGADSYPLGRIVFGYPPGVKDQTENFYAAQKVQAPALTPDTNWLAVGHIDEAFSYVPASTDRGWKLLVASPDLCRTMLQQWQTDGHGAAIMFQNKMGWHGSTWTNVQTSVSEMLADTGLESENQYAQGKIDVMEDMYIAAVGLTTDEIVYIPFFYENIGGNEYLALHPGTVNSLVFGNTFAAPDPFGPLINGYDGFKKDLEDRMATSANSLGSDGQGMNIYWVDDWYDYHNNMGEVHCATNQEGPPALDAWWEVQR